MICNFHIQLCNPKNTTYTSPPFQFHTGKICLKWVPTTALREGEREEHYRLMPSRSWGKGTVAGQPTSFPADANPVLQGSPLPPPSLSSVPLLTWQSQEKRSPRRVGVRTERFPEQTSPLEQRYDLVSKTHIADWDLFSPLGEAVLAFTGVMICSFHNYRLEIWKDPQRTLVIVLK